MRGCHDENKIKSNIFVAINLLRWYTLVINNESFVFATHKSTRDILNISKSTILKFNYILWFIHTHYSYKAGFIFGHCDVRSLMGIWNRSQPHYCRIYYLCNKSVCLNTILSNHSMLCSCWIEFFHPIKYFNFDNIFMDL